METYTTSVKLINYLKKFAPVYTIFGNVELSNSEVRMLSKKYDVKLPFIYDKLKSMKNVKIINNIKVNFNGIKIGGLKYFFSVKWVKEFKPKNYDKAMKIAVKETEKAKKVLEYFDKVDILITHQLPFGILDKVNSKFVPDSWNGKSAGSKIILDYIKKKKPKYVFCGHIHEGKGKYILKHKNGEKTEIYNLGEAGYKIINIK